MAARNTIMDTLSEVQVLKLTELVAHARPWSEILAWLASEDVAVTEATVRRWCTKQGIKKDRAIQDADERQRILDQNLAAVAGDDLETLRSRNEYLETEVKDASRTIKALRKQTNRDVAMATAVVDAVEEFFDDRTMRVQPAYTPKRGSGTPQEFVAHISDMHYGEVVDPELTFGLSYNPEIARKRMEYLTEKICRYAELRPYEISKLHVAYLGDMVSGIQHEDLDTTNARSMMDQALEVAELMHQQLAAFADHFPVVSATVITGNHGRVHKQGRHKAPFESWDFLAGKVVERTTRLALDDRVTVNVPRASREIIEVCGKRIALMHGDGIKAANFAGIPFYSSKAKHDALQTLLRKLGLPPVDQISVGHFHQHLHWPNVMVFNGSIKGGDEYVMDTRLAYTPAQQLLQEWHPRYGLTTHDFIDVDNVR